MGGGFGRLKSMLDARRCGGKDDAGCGGIGLGYVKRRGGASGTDRSGKY
jgi:hypothetical protein